MRAFVYLRQSLDRTGSGSAVERQREDCLKLCRERGWEVARVYSDNDVSASSTKPRPEYTRMLEAVERGEAEILTAWHVDRLTRKITDLEHLIEVAQRTGLRIATVTGDLDLSTDAGRLVGRILASVARGEVERKGARQKRAQQQAAQQGRPAGGRRPFGYDRDGMTVREAEAAELRAAYRTLLEGGSLKGIARRWNDAGITTTAGNRWSHSTVRNTLKNPRYAGHRTYRGEVVGPATWPALVDADTFDAARALLALPGRLTTTGTARKYLLPGLARCWCGSDVTTGRTRHNKRSYNCRAAKHLSRAADPIDALIAGGVIDGIETHGLVVERLSRPDAVDLLSEPTTPDLSTYRAQAQAIRDRLDDLATGLEEGFLTLGAVKRSSERLRAELAEVEAKMRTATHADVLGPLVTAQDPGEVWRGYDLKQKRATIDALMTVTLLAPKRGRQAFDPDTVEIEWKGGAVT
jgi:site-specific DNA recombinase